MNLRMKIFVRIFLLIFLLIIAIGISAWKFESYHRRKDTLHIMQERIDVLANEADSFGLHKDSSPLLHMLVRLVSITPAGKFAFVEKDSTVLLSSKKGENLGLYLGWASSESGGHETRRIIDSQGNSFLDIAALINIQDPSETPFYLHVVLDENSFGIKSWTWAISIALVCIITLLLSVPAIWVIARLTTSEVNKLTTKLEEYGVDLEEKVALRTKSLHQAQEALKETEERYRSLFEGISNGVAVYSPVDNGNDFVFVDYNPAGQAMDNVTREEALGKKVTEVFPAVEKFGLLDVLRKVNKSGVSESLPVSVYEDGKMVFWRQNTVHRLPSGELVAVYSDETSRMEAEQLLRGEHARFEAVLESLDAVVYAADMETYELLFANKSVRDMFGEVTGKTCWKMIQSGQTEPCAFCTNDRLLDSDGEPTDPYLWEFQNTSDGRWYQCHDQAIRWPDGRMVRLEIATDITDRKLREEEVELRGKYLKGLSDAAHALICATGEAPLQEFVDAMGPCSNSSRAYVFMNHFTSDGELLMDQKAEWCDEGIPQEIENQLLQNLSYDDWLPLWKSLLSEGETINKCLKDFSAGERDLLGGQGIKAILVMPIIIGNDFVGFVGLDNCVSETEWNESEVRFLHTATSDLAQTIRRLRSEKKVLVALNEKDVLLREIHHRVKNNMQVITSLLNLQARKISDENALTAIRESQDRIHVMSLVHETLYRSSDLSSIAMADYFTKLITDIARVHIGYGDNIQWIVDAGRVTLTINEAIPIGLIANELISNAFKHAFPSGRKGAIKLALHDIGNGEMELVVADDGQGLPANINVHGADTLGLQLVNRLAEGQLGGELDIRSEGGTTVRITFFNGFQEKK